MTRMSPPPTPPEKSAPKPRWILPAAVALGVVGIMLAARVSFTLPTAPVPQSLQTLAVLLVAMLGGLRVAVVTLALYIALGAAGLPVFADGAAGWAHASGPSAGYLLGFVLAAALVGAVADRGYCRHLVGAFTFGLIGHVIVLGAGWVGLLRFASVADAWQRGVAPFADGAVAKSLLLGLLMLSAGLAGRLQRRFRLQQSP